MVMPIKNLSLISLPTGALTCILENQEVYSKRLACVVGVEMGRGYGGREKGRGLGREGKGRLL